MSARGWTLGLAAPAILLAQSAPRAPASGRTPQRPAPATFVATEFAFRGPATLPAGLTTLRLVNRGRAVHQGQLLFVPSGYTADQAARAVTAGESAGWLRPAGGFGPVAPGDTARVTLTLATGSYLMYSALPNADGVSDARRGLVITFTVSAAGGARADTTAAVAALSVSDFGFRFRRLLRMGSGQRTIDVWLMPGPLPHGEFVIEIENSGPSAHEVRVVRGESPRTVRDLVAWLDGGQRGPAPARPLGGVGLLQQGMKARLHLALQSGAYWIFCTARHRNDARGFEGSELTEFVVR